MTMFTEADRIYRHIEQNYLTKKDNWSDVNMTYPEGQQLQSVVDAMASQYFGGYRKNKTITIGSEHFSARMLPPQNKHSRSNRAYGSGSYAGAESYANLMIYSRGSGGKTMLNMHIILRTLKAEAAAAKKDAKKVVDADGWSTA